MAYIHLTIHHFCRHFLVAQSDTVQPTTLNPIIYYLASALHTSSTSIPSLNLSSMSNGSISSSTSPHFDSGKQNVLLRVKLPDSHPLITKVLKFPLTYTVKDTLDHIHELVVLENRVNLIILFKQQMLPHHHPLSNYFVCDDGYLPTIEIREVSSMSSSSSLSPLNGNGSRPKLLHSSSVQNLLNSMPTRQKRTSGGKDNLMFQPPHPSYTKELDKLFWVSSPSFPQKSIPCLFHKWRSRDEKTESKLTILYSGGDREDLGLIRKNIRILSDILQCNILCYDYTGFGLNSSGKPTMKELFNDISVVFNYLTVTLAIPPSNIIFLKFASGLYAKTSKATTSKNSTPTQTTSGGDKRIGGMILLSAFGHAGISENIVNMFLSLDSFDHLKKIDKITCPVMLVHGEEDDIVSIKSAKKLSKSFPNLYQYMPIKDATHWNLDTQYLDDYADEMLEFVKSIAPEAFDRKERSLPTSYAMSPSKVVGAWLDRLQLSEYTSNFLRAGYFEMMSIASLDECMLEDLGVQQEHMTTLLGEINKLAASRHSVSSSDSSPITDWHVGTDGSKRSVNESLQTKRRWGMPNTQRQTGKHHRYHDAPLIVTDGASPPLAPLQTFGQINPSKASLPCLQLRPAASEPTQCKHHAGEHVRNTLDWRQTELHAFARNGVVTTIKAAYNPLFERGCGATHEPNTTRVASTMKKNKGASGEQTATTLDPYYLPGVTPRPDRRATSARNTQHGSDNYTKLTISAAGISLL
eukprot:gene16007-19045_t